MDIKAIVSDLCKEHDTRNPFDLAASLGVIVLHEPLGEIQGFYHCCYRQQFIHINEKLDGYEALFTCAHEVGHSILHQGINTPFLRKHTLFSVAKIETEADRFALELLFDDEELLPFLTRSITDAAAFMGMPERLAEYRIRSIPRKIILYP